MLPQGRFFGVVISTLTVCAGTLFADQSAYTLFPDSEFSGVQHQMAPSVDSETAAPVTSPREVTPAPQMQKHASTSGYAQPLRGRTPQGGIAQTSYTTRTIGSVETVVISEEETRPEIHPPVVTSRHYPAMKEAAPPIQPRSSDTLAADPFEYQYPEENAGFVPSRLASLPPEIQLVGILMFKDRPAIAAVRFPKTGKGPGEVHYVHEGDDIEIPVTLLRTGTGRQAQPDENREIIYLKVQRITAQHVEVSSQSNLDDRHLLR